MEDWVMGGINAVSPVHITSHKKAFLSFTKQLRLMSRCVTPQDLQSWEAGCQLNETSVSSCLKLLLDWAVMCCCSKCVQLIRANSNAYQPQLEDLAA